MSVFSQFGQLLERPLLFGLGVTSLARFYISLVRLVSSIIILIDIAIEEVSSFFAFVVGLIPVTLNNL